MTYVHKPTQNQSYFAQYPLSIIINDVAEEMRIALLPANDRVMAKLDKILTENRCYLSQSGQRTSLFHSGFLKSSQDFEIICPDPSEETPVIQEASFATALRAGAALYAVAEIYTVSQGRKLLIKVLIDILRQATRSTRDETQVVPAEATPAVTTTPEPSAPESPPKPVRQKWEKLLTMAREFVDTEQSTEINMVFLPATTPETRRFVHLVFKLAEMDYLNPDSRHYLEDKACAKDLEKLLNELDALLDKMKKTPVGKKAKPDTKPVDELITKIEALLRRCAKE